MTAVAIDWSGAVRPAGKIWIAEASGGVLRRLEPLRSRESALDDVLRYGDSPDHVVVGLDFSFSLPAWFCRRKGVSSAPELWTLVAENGERWLQQCRPPFWGRPGKRRPLRQAHFRTTETRAGRDGIRPKSTFQIGGSGTVGTGSIRGMPFLARLRAAGFAVWPFDPPGARMVVEIYPRLLTGPVVKSSGRGRAHYLATARWMLPTALSAKARRSEDAFDAAISSLVMAEHLDEFSMLPRGDALSQIEGEIWVPSRCSSSTAVS